jgi:hypothetical protein
MYQSKIGYRGAEYRQKDCEELMSMYLGGGGGYGFRTNRPVYGFA